MECCYALSCAKLGECSDFSSSKSWTLASAIWQLLQFFFLLLSNTTHSSIHLYWSFLIKCGLIRNWKPVKTRHALREPVKSKQTIRRCRDLVLLKGQISCQYLSLNTSLFGLEVGKYLVCITKAMVSPNFIKHIVRETQKKHFPG